ncbi:NAD/NADP octopine/nopaline dehydrogenase family protein [Fervidobacterium riparium]|jgi:opine dehydrogenase|uniref:Glycerol-3-phosphate dehydrogenase n=1 Tax=Fervidobacterium pennivorans (strain DSM 9078 / Ven5) TaxID=771875 RepID=H9UBG7_FERPD|nr:NAD/NADP-dependent octopine/nopaline dehydrogenase family protein [Fervidobacterium pennivorans]AFG34860.1 glycerol-3-phosphate dehydrogenase [Fervidobacterium pennivorans DSM 9078]QIV78230.1 NAD(P)-binding domain-containing protein [Fervidobacterium pennivorans subsp. keratinolyticus]QIV78241.1 NAD(P)-binding domain-containing protein [Fervidobacterium pennivorans subsp. keratinolyticus]UXF00302.1 NADP transhydrogenase subunit alpha [Fervidobacterium riparium]
MKVCIIGGGNGGQALAGVLALRGFDVSLYNRSEQRIERIIKTKKIELQGSISGITYISFATTDLREAISGRQLLLVVLPAFAHREIALKLAPYLEDGQIIILNPGRTAGALEFYTALKQFGVDKDITVAEAQTFLFASRITGPGVVKIFGVKNAVPVAALPAQKNTILKDAIEKVLPEFRIVPNTLHTSFANIGAVFHPASVLLNAGWIESTSGDFEFYTNGISPSVAKVLQAIDDERCAVAKSFGLETMSALEWLKYAYSVEGEDLYEALQLNKAYKGIKAPSSIDNRYILEDVPMSLVPISEFGKVTGVRTPTIDTIISLASVMLGRDFRKEGRTLEKLGLLGKSPEEVKRIMEVGI